MPGRFRRISLRRPIFVSATVLLSFQVGQAAHAQSETTFLDLSSSEIGESYASAVENKRIDIETRYVDQTDQDFLEARTVQRNPIEPRAVINGLNGFGIAVVLAMIGLLIFLFLKYGGAGGLLRSDPSEAAKKKRKTRAWGLTAEENEAGDILSRIRAMSDRREALILLLRHCLLQAAHESDVNFRRSDTEREALGRLPSTWRQFQKLVLILKSTELVHYGGRSISDDAYEVALAHGETILRHRA